MYIEIIKRERVTCTYYVYARPVCRGGLQQQNARADVPQEKQPEKYVTLTHARTPHTPPPRSGLPRPRFVAFARTHRRRRYPRSSLPRPYVECRACTRRRPGGGRHPWARAVPSGWPRLGHAHPTVRADPGLAVASPPCGA